MKALVREHSWQSRVESGQSGSDDDLATMRESLASTRKISIGLERRIEMESILPSLIPLFQSFLWVVLIISLVFYFREDITLLRDELRRRIKSGDPFEFGPIKLIEKKVKYVENEIRVNKQFFIVNGSRNVFQPQENCIRQLRSI